MPLQNPLSRELIDDLSDSLLTLSEQSGTLTADGLEQNVVIEDAPPVVFKPGTVIIDLDTMTAAVGADAVTIKVYQRIKTGGGLQLYDYATYSGADGSLTDGKKLIKIDLWDCRWGFKVTLEQTARDDGLAYKDFDWEYIPKD